MTDTNAMIEEILFRCHHMKPRYRDAAFNIYRCVCEHLGVDADQREAEFVERQIAAGAVEVTTEAVQR